MPPSTKRMKFSEFEVECDDMKDVLLKEESKRTATDAWTRILGECVFDTSYSLQFLQSAIAIQNPEEHLNYCTTKIDLHPNKKIDSGKTLGFEIDGESDSESDKENIEAPPRIICIHKLKPSQFYEQYVERTEEQCTQELQAPQRSKEWLEARKYCITASQFGSAMGISPYQTPEALLVEKVWFTFQGNAACDWGTEHEPRAKESFIKWFEKCNATLKFREENLMKFTDMPWIGVSPDGIIEYINDQGEKQVDLVEFKCPAYLRNTVSHPYKKHPGNIPPQYYAQMQGIMGFLNAHGYNMKQAWFVVWQPHQTWITKVPFDIEFYTNELFPKVKDWYFSKYLPALTHKHNGLLDFGDIYPSEELVL